MFSARGGPALAAPPAPATAQSRGSARRTGTCCRARQVAGAAHPDQLGDWADAWLERIAVLYRAHHALVSATAPGTDAYEAALGRCQRAFPGLHPHRIPPPS